MTRILLTFGILFLFGMIKINASNRQSNHKADQIIRDICERLNENDLYHYENKKWYLLCQEWIEKNQQKRYELVQDATIMNDSYTKHIYRPRRARGGRGGRFSLSGFRGFRSGSHSSSSIVRFHNIRTGARIIRPTGWQWTRAQSAFLPISTRFHHRSYPFYNRYTTQATSSVTYYYCTSTGNRPVEIQCNTIHGDTKCCENEATQQVFCCGGKISDNFIEDANRAVQIFARVFYTLTAVTLCIHVFMRRFY